MTKVRDILAKIEERFPCEIASPGDHVGLLVGDLDASVTKVVIALDASYDVVEFAISQGAELIVAHHPIFLPDDCISFTAENDESKRMLVLANNKLNFIAMHTNMDAGKGGINDMLLQKLGVSSDFDLHGGLLKGGKVEKRDFSTFIERVKTAFDVDFVLKVGDLAKEIISVAVSSGGASSMTKAAFEAGVDLFFTGEIKHSDAIFARENSMCVLAVGHFATEIVCKDIYLELLKGQFDDIELILADESPSAIEI